MKIGVLAGEKAITGFKLAGVKNVIRASENQKELEDQFQKMSEDKELGLLIISKKVSEMVRDKVEETMLTKDFPAIIEINETQEDEQKEGLIDSITKKAIGSTMV